MSHDRAQQGDPIFPDTDGGALVVQFHMDHHREGMGASQWPIFM